MDHYLSSITDVRGEYRANKYSEPLVQIQNGTKEYVYIWLDNERVFDKDKKMIAPRELHRNN